MPKKKNKKKPSSGRPFGQRRPIATKIVRRLRKESMKQVIDLAAFRQAKEHAESVHETFVQPEALVDHHPFHAYYVVTQNQASVWAEMLTALPEADRLARLVGRAEDEYVPGAPPMSPLTTSFFTCWAFFDACVGLSQETLGTTAIAVAESRRMPSGFIEALRRMQASRMGVYVHEGAEAECVILRELVTQSRYRAISTSGYAGQPGQLWYVRLMPPPVAGFDQHVVFTTPYVMGAATLGEWEAYFERTLPGGAEPRRQSAYEAHMKWGPARDYWTEFVFEAYVNHQHDAIFLRGLPDIPESRPHSRINSLHITP